MINSDITFNAPIFSMTRFYCPSFLERETRISPQIVLCGGGGSSKTGIHNFIKVGGMKRDADGQLSFKTLGKLDTETELLHEIICASNGRFLFGSCNNKTMIYRVIRGSDDQSIKLEFVLSKVTDDSEKGIQSAIAIKKDDTTILTGNSKGELSIWKFELDENKKCSLRLLQSISLFETEISSIAINPTEHFAAIGSDKGDIAIIDLSTLGVSQRIPHKENRLSIKSILFPSSSMFVVVECEKRQNTTLRLYSYDNSKEMKWREKSTCYLRNRIICTAFYEENNSIMIFGTNEGEIAVYEFPSLRLYMNFFSLRDEPISALTYLPPNLPLLTVEERLKNAEEYKKSINQNIDDNGWIVSSTAFSHVSVTRLQQTARTVTIGRILYVLFLLFIILIGYQMISHTK